MSAFAAIFERSNTPLEPGLLERVMDRLAHRGPDGSDVRQVDRTVLGHWHFWTTPEEVGERQPLELEGMPFVIVLDGRLDNRSDLVNELKINPVEGKCLSDAALVLYAYDRWGESCFGHLIGEFALVILDKRGGKLACARDSLGERTLFYSFKGTRLMVVSEPWAIVGAVGQGVELSESAVAHYFALEANEDGQTLFKNVYELQPACVMVVTGSSQRTWRYWQPDPSIILRGKSDEDYAEPFLSLLEESVRCRLRSTTSVGVQMSGGLDSTSLACLAARMLAQQPLTTISYVFDELLDCDERKYINEVKTHSGIRSIQILGDNLWPYKEWQKWPHNPNNPELNLYRLLVEQVYIRAQDEGLRVLLTGTYGDHLYTAGSEWIADLVKEGRLWEAGRELNILIHKKGLYQTLATGQLQSIGRSLLDLIYIGSKRLSRRQTLPVWYNPVSASLLRPDEGDMNPVFRRYGSLLGMDPTGGVAREIYYASRHSLELRSPYRDRRLVEFVLTLPAYQLKYHGYYKHILRTAMRGILPEMVRTRSTPTSLITLYFRGVEREKMLLSGCFQNTKAVWRKYVLADWLLKHWDIVLTPDKDGLEALVPWLCVSFEAWNKQLV